MAFPTTALLDAFGGTLSSWTNSRFGDGALTIVSGAVCGPSAGVWGGAVWTSAFNADCEAYTTINALGTAGDDFAVWARATAVGGTPTGYQVVIHKATPDTWTLKKVVTGTPTTLASGTFTLGTGDAIGIDVIGTAVSCYRKPSAGSWAQLGTATDGTIVAAGQIGLEVFSQTWKLDNFSGGNYVAASGQTILPDADLATGGWTTAPLFSKVNDASDATLITATAA